MKTMKILGIAGAMLASALVGGTLISVVAANSGGSSPTSTTLATDSQPGAYCQTFLDTFAAKLGVDESALLPAAKAAADAAIDKAVADGKLSQTLGDQLKARIAKANGNGCALLGQRWQRLVRGTVVGDIGADMIQAAASALHLSIADLKSKIVGGETLKQVATDQKVDYAAVAAAVHAAAKTDLDKLVSAGKLTAARETAILDRIDRALANGRLGRDRIRPPLLRPFAPNTPASPSASPSGASG
ncbi:MAG TPA: hypothetical protein VKU35_02280 [Candidatus Limnocylindria bacterium]|nr:hypothetical protein [Candidatus Limnocylindria bacterium]